MKKYRYEELSFPPCAPVFFFFFLIGPTRSRHAIVYTTYIIHTLQEWLLYEAIIIIIMIMCIVVARLSIYTTDRYIRRNSCKGFWLLLSILVSTGARRISPSKRIGILFYSIKYLGFKLSTNIRIAQHVGETFTRATLYPTLRHWSPISIRRILAIYKIHISAIINYASPA